MKVRPFDWRDLSALHRVRDQSVYLHSALVLTRGPLLIPGALLSTLAPGMGIYTSISFNDQPQSIQLFGQIIHAAGAQCAQLTFLSPDEALESEHLQVLLEHLSSQAVERGAFRLLADVDERTLAFEMLRQAGFAIYARQRIWRLKDDQANGEGPLSWQTATERDLIAVRSLYNNLIPGLVQQVEPFPAERLRGLVYRQGGDLLAYVELKYGHRGIWAQPFIHPDAENVAENLIALLSNLPHRVSRPVYMCLRSYQSWLEPTMEHVGAEPSPRQAMMVRHVAIPQKALRAFTLPAIEGGHPEATAPISRARVSQSEAVKSTTPQMEKQLF
ncbi:MAG: hypothetical protein JSV61_00055 [Anaerolineales bacterium]|nr:MAG: hypothetical protein JSV61_00055 [Anaerolineales bacterium]